MEKQIQTIRLNSMCFRTCTEVYLIFRVSNQIQKYECFVWTPEYINIFLVVFLKLKINDKVLKHVTTGQHSQKILNWFPINI